MPPVTVIVLAVILTITIMLGLVIIIIWTYKKWKRKPTGAAALESNIIRPGNYIYWNVTICINIAHTL